MTPVAITLGLTLLSPALRPAEPSAMSLDALCTEAFTDAVRQFPDDKLTPEDVGISLAFIDRPNKSVSMGGYRASVTMYPASVVKMFYFAYAAHLLDTGQLKMTPELQRAAEDMIKVSSNDATGYMIDLCCGTTPGPELSPDQLAEFGRKRRAVNDWFGGLGYSGVNAVQRTFNEGPYGRERQWVGEKYENRNMLSPEACTRLMAGIALGKHWSKEQTAWMQGILARLNPQDEPDKADGQSKAYTGRVIPKGAKLWSKAGWTSEVRHDCAWVEMPDGREYVVTVFTKRGNNRLLVSSIAAGLFRRLGYEIPEPEATPEELRLMAEGVTD